MIDIHCHLLPGIDDGANTMAQSLDMARLAVAEGITRIVVTPHINPGRWNNDRLSIATATEAFKQCLAQDNIPLEVDFAAEVRVSDQIPRQIEAEEIPFLGNLDGYKVMLLEFPHRHLVPGTDNLVRWLVRNGIRPLIAHPERNAELVRTPDKLLPLIDLGCLAQITAASLTGRFGEGPAATAHHYLGEGVVSFLASDAHNTSTRPPAMAEARDMVANLLGDDIATGITVTMPRLLVGADNGTTADA